jgi:hypothetical protein
MGLDHADDDVDARLQFGVGALQHFVGLADARCCADEDFEPAGLIVLSPGGFEKRVRRGSFFKVAALICHTAI